MITTKLAAGLAAGVILVGGLFAFRWMHPCEGCPISTAIGWLGGPSGCAPANDHAQAQKAPGASTQTAMETPSQPATTATPSKTEPSTMTTRATGAKTETAMFGGGCFWGVEGIFRKIPGVVDTTVGYSGGTTPDATYKQVCSHTTGHAEVVKVDFDPSQISYEKLVQKFFKLHDPTQVNRQGPDFGTQYRSVIFYYSPEQQKTAEAVKKHLDASGKYKAPIATEITKVGEFWRAEEYHQQYFEKNHMENNCHVPLDDDD